MCYHTYYQKNKDKILQQTKIYQQNNKEKIRAHNMRVLKCICGKTYTATHKKQHMISKKHIEGIKNEKQWIKNEQHKLKKEMQASINEMIIVL